MNNNVYSTPSASLGTTNHTPPTKAGLILKISGILLTLLTMLVAIAKSSLTAPYPGVVVGRAIAPIFWGLIIVGLFQFSRAFRNQKSRYTVYFWCQVIFLVRQLYALTKAIIASGA